MGLRTAGLSTALRSVEKHSQERRAGPQVSPLRSLGAPVEMTKGRVALPGIVAAGREPFFSSANGVRRVRRAIRGLLPGDAPYILGRYGD